MKQFGGFLLGTSLGFLLGVFLFVTWLPSLDAFAGEKGWGLLLIIPVGILATTVIGAIAGTVFAHMKRKSNSVSIAIGLAGVGLWTAIMLYGVLHFRSVQKENAQRALERAEEEKDWDQVYGAAYPKTEASLPALLGPMRYPGSQLVRWEELPRRNAALAPTWEIDDAIVPVLLYYMRVLVGGLEFHPRSSDGSASWRFTSFRQESKDSREVFVRIEDGGDQLALRFTTTYLKTIARARIAGPPLPVAWPESLEEIHIRIAKSEEGLREKIETQLDPHVYPGSRRIVSRFPIRGTVISPNGIYITEDGWVTVREHLEATLGAELAESRIDSDRAVFEGALDNGLNLRVTAYSGSGDGPFDFVYLIYKTSTYR